MDGSPALGWPHERFGATIMAKRLQWAALCTALLTLSTNALAQTPSASEPQISSAELDAGKLFIQGKNFGTSSTPTVLLGGGDLGVVSYAATVIVATVDASLPAGS